jgi:raffinose/stachyose/melibiose transport system substrate-binding protein
VRRFALLATTAATASLLGVAAIPVATTAASANQVNIIEWVNPPAVTAVNAIDKLFTAATHIKTNLTTAISRPTTYAALEQTSVQSGSKDIMAVEPLQPAPTGMPTTDLTSEQAWGVSGEYVALNNQPWVQNLLPAARAAQTYDGKLYGMNTGSYQVGIFYNKAMFAKYHVSPATTYTAFLKLCRTLKADGVQPLYYATAGGAVTDDWDMLLASELSGLWSGDVDSQFWSGTASFTDPRFIQALNQAKTIVSYAEPNWQGENWVGMAAALASGKAAMVLDGSWDMASALQANPKLQIGYFPLPSTNVPARNLSIVRPDLVWVILKNGPDRAAALKWLDFFAQPKIYALYVKDTGISPSFKGNFPSATATILGKYLSKGRINSEVEPSLPSAGPYAIQENNLASTLQSVLLGQTSPRTAAEEWESAWKQMLAAAKK